MKRMLLAALIFGAGARLCDAADFQPPVRLKAGDAAIRVEAPGFAAPCWTELNGKQVLLVGQFNNGQIRVFPQAGAGKFAPGEWLKADGKVAQVPGVW